MTTPIANISETVSVSVGIEIVKVIALVRVFPSIISHHPRTIFIHSLGCHSMDGVTLLSPCTDATASLKESLLADITVCTVVQNCCKGDEPCQWNTPIFRPSEIENP